MPITPEELAALEPVLAGDAAEHELLKPLIDKGFVVRTPKQDETYQKNFVEMEFTKREPTAYSNVEKSVEELTGIKKASPTEKASEYFVRAMNTYKQGITTMQTELDDLKKKQEEGFGDKDAAKRIKQLEDLIKTTQETHTQELSQKEQAIFTAKVEGQVESALGTIRANIKKEYTNIADDVLEARLNKFYKTYTPKKAQDGKTVFEDAAGTLQINPKTALALTPKEIVTDFFKDLTEEKGGHQQQGAGSGGTGGRAEWKAGDPIPAPGANIKTRVQLTTYMKEYGLKSGEKDYDDFYKKHSEGLSLR